MAATLNNVDAEDTWEAHAFDTVKGSDYLADQDAVEILTREAPDVVIDLEHMGVLFSRLPDGRIAQRAFGGHSHRRTCYAADKTGHAILHELVNNLRRNGVRIYDEWYVTQLILEDGSGKRRCDVPSPGHQPLGGTGKSCDVCHRGLWTGI
jgi:succinate dehydrogenase / fumarate reductase flavoprotein subunit